MTCGLHRNCAADAPDRCPWCESSRHLAEVARLRTRVAELEKLAYIGEHHFPDLTYKARLEALLAERASTSAKPGGDDG